MIIDGRTYAQKVLARTKARAVLLHHTPHVLAIVASETPATKSYLSIKAKRAIDAGCVLEIVRLPESTDTPELVETVLSAQADAIIVQLPLSAGVSVKEVCDAIPASKDADVLSKVARERFEQGVADALLPPVVGAVQEILCENVIVKGKKATVIGNGWLVGAPVATWLEQQGADVTIITSKSEDLSTALRAADIIVSGVGSPHFIKPDMVKHGSILIDAGTSESGGALVGDADPACESVCSIFTPVPGGVGPLAVAKLFENAVALAERALAERRMF